VAIVNRAETAAGGAGRWLAAGNDESALFKRWAATLLAHKCQVRVRRYEWRTRKSGYKLGQPTPLATVAELVDYDAPVLLAPRVRAAEAAPIEQ